jgi:hypothetical protein
MDIEKTPAGEMLAAAGFFPSKAIGSWVKGGGSGPGAQIVGEDNGLGENVHVNTGEWCANVYEADDDGRCVHHEAVGLANVIEWCLAGLNDPEPLFAAAKAAAPSASANQAYPATMDPECIPLCDALNALPGIRTTESCCGHGEDPHRIWFDADKIESLRPILWATRYHMVSRSPGEDAWVVEAGWANGGNVIYFMLEGPRDGSGKKAKEFSKWVKTGASAP